MNRYRTPRNGSPNQQQDPVGLGLNQPMPRHLPDPDSSYEYAPHPDTSLPEAEDFSEDMEGFQVPGSGGNEAVVEGEEEEEDDEEGEGDDDDDDGESVTSSAMYDLDEDPVAWRERLDQLAGKKEISEEEARAIRWGPYIPLKPPSTDLSILHFKEFINHYLASTEWKYQKPPDLFLTPIGRGPPIKNALTDDGAQYAIHPIRVLPTSWVDGDEQEEVSEAMIVE